MMNGTFEITMSQCHAHVISVGDIGYHSHAQTLVGWGGVGWSGVGWGGVGLGGVRWSGEGWVEWGGMGWVGWGAVGAAPYPRGSICISRNVKWIIAIGG
jgi:hypothetical protein